MNAYQSTMPRHEAFNVALSMQEQEKRYSYNQFPGLSADLKLVDPQRLTQIRLTISAVTARELFENIEEMTAEALARGYIVDEWPFNPSHGLTPPQPEPTYEPIPDAADEFGIPDMHTQDEINLFIRSEAFRALPGDIQTQIAVAAALGDKPAIQRGEQPAYLRGLLDANGEPMMHLPTGAALPTDDRRPQKWCPDHRLWMWQRTRADGKGHWFSHPNGDQFCKGKKTA